VAHFHRNGGSLPPEFPTRQKTNAVYEVLETTSETVLQKKAGTKKAFSTE
jgi:hypothetical protein